MLSAIVLTATFSLVSACGPQSVALDLATAAAEFRNSSEIIDDASIKAKILKDMTGLDTKNLIAVNVDPHQGRVMLSGAVKSADVKTKVGEFAKAQPEVKAVYNDIVVTDEGGLKQSANDLTIKGKLKAQLLGEKGVSSINYIYQVVNGYVFVVGVAESQAELDKVLQIARGIADVRQVVPHIRVDASRKKS